MLLSIKSGYQAVFEKGAKWLPQSMASKIPPISLDWADQAWSSNFCEPVELPEVLENRVVDCKYFVGELGTLLVSLKHWSTRCINQSLKEGKRSLFDRF